MSIATFILGESGTGKSTLVQDQAARRGRRYLTLDDGATLAAARGDPPGWCRA